MLIIVKKMINILSYVIIGLWGLLTIIVIVFLINRWTNPGWKSISNNDLKDYGQITVVVLVTIGFLFFIRLLINKGLDSE
jgi:hypothetical protein